MVSVLIDDDRAERLDDLLDSTEYSSKSDVLRDAIDVLHDQKTDYDVEDNDEHDEQDEQDEDTELYNPDNDRNEPLTTDEISDIMWSIETPAINPDHLQTLPRPRNDRAAIIAAVARYGAVDSAGGVSETDVEDAIINVVGRGAEGRLMDDYRGIVMDMVDTETTCVPDNMTMTCNRVLGLVTVEEWRSNVSGIMDIPDDDAREMAIQDQLETGREVLRVAEEDAPMRETVETVVAELQAELE